MIDERLQNNFWLSEFLRSDMAVRKGLDNTPLPTEMANIRNVLAPGMQRIRNHLRQPVLITSGYRGPEVNRAVGGSVTSQHLHGLAADIICPEYGPPRAVALELQAHMGVLRIDQLIYEGNWVHVSFVPGKPRNESLTAHFRGGRVDYSPGIA